jgi:hypothetical protein
MLRRLASVFVLSAASTGVVAATAAEPALAVGAGTPQKCGVVKAAGWFSTLGPAGTPRGVWGLGKMIGNTWSVKAYGPHGATPSTNLCPNAVATAQADSSAASPAYKTTSGATVTGPDGASCVFGGTAGSERGFNRPNGICQATWGVATFAPVMPVEASSACKNLVGAKHGTIHPTKLWFGREWGASCSLVAKLTRRLSGRLVSYNGTKVRHYTLPGSPLRWVCNLYAFGPSASCAQMGDLPGYGPVRIGPELVFAVNAGVLRGI